MCQVQGLPFPALELQDRKALCQLEFFPGSDNGFPKQEQTREPLAVPSTGLLTKKGAVLCGTVPSPCLSNNAVALLAQTQLCHQCQLLSRCYISLELRGKQTAVHSPLEAEQRGEKLPQLRTLHPRLSCFEEYSSPITFLLNFIYY